MNYEITRLSLENEMDLVLAHKRSIRLGELLNLSVASQTSFTTAISECCREVLERTGSGLLVVEIMQESAKTFLTAKIRYTDPENANPSAYGSALDYARRLVTHFSVYQEEFLSNIELRTNIPRPSRLTSDKIYQIIEVFKQVNPTSPYEMVKLKKDELKRIAAEQEEQLIRSRYVNEKKTEFLSIASHELKTPLTTIKAFTQLAMTEGSNLPENVQMYLSKINLQTDKLYKLIQQLLDISKVESGQLDFTMEEAPMNAYIRDTVSLLAKSIPTHPIFIEVTTEDVIARIDKLRLEQVFSNLIVNAAKYSNERSPIRIFAAIEPGKMLRISVRDEGIGMSEQNIRRVFEKFFRAEEIVRSYSGLGMGLYIASRIINAHGGRIWIDSKLDVGSTFHFTIPYLKKAEAIVPE
ncbi:MAG TPA: HAMP domain-containing sensor histidine kinase [Puia sp.]|nr:HAMP domain-containing sensor histidine kinase [Puia sp.]